MKSRLAEISLPERPVRWFGIALLVVGFAFPFAVLVMRAASWQPAAEATEDSLDLELVKLDEGTFLMGSPKGEEGRGDDETLHEVQLDAFAFSRTEITQGQYFAVMGERPVEAGKDYLDRPCSGAGVGEELPVVCVDWFEAVKFCNGLSLREGLEPAYEIQGEEVLWKRTATGYRLPTEAEWEYAARAGTRFTWVGTNKAEEACEYANVGAGFPCEDSFPTLAPVSAFKTNRWLLFGLGGNAAEWVWDAYESYPEKAGEDPALTSDWKRASYRVIRGGSWRSNPRFARVANRFRYEPSRRYYNVGFRVARSLPSAL